MSQQPTVFVVDDDPAVRDSLRLLLESVGLVAETFSSAHQFLDATEPEQSGCVLLDIRMPGMSGLELQRRLVARGITLPVIIITGHGDVTTAVQAMKTGAVDFLEKPFNDQVLLDRIHDAINRDTQARRARAEQDEVGRHLATLSPREVEVLDLIIAGKANKVIALDLGISEKTVEAHRARTMDKMQVRSTADLVRTVLLYRTSRPTADSPPDTP
ncbi:Transcriptional regulatory protein FixJ [Gammaproteobacteria bacterium]